MEDAIASYTLKKPRRYPRAVPKETRLIYTGCYVPVVPGQTKKNQIGDGTVTGTIANFIASRGNNSLLDATVLKLSLYILRNLLWKACVDTWFFDPALPTSFKRSRPLFLFSGFSRFNPTKPFRLSVDLLQYTATPSQKKPAASAVVRVAVVPKQHDDDATTSIVLQSEYIFWQKGQEPIYS
eukprot:scaffold25842_cov198-Amphora_coffeaeformis.AAC.31